MSSLPSPHPRPNSLQSLLLLALVVAVIMVINAVIWGTASELPVIDPATGRQVNQWEPWD